MKKGDVQLFTSKVKMNNNQHTSIRNEHQEQLDVQKSLNDELSKHISELTASSLRMINSIKKQEAEFERRGKIEKRSRLYVKQVINHMAYTIEQLELQVRRQNKLMQRLTENNNGQNEQASKTEAQLQQVTQHVNQQRVALRNISRKQSYYFDEILNQLQAETKIELHQEKLLSRFNDLEEKLASQFAEQVAETEKIKTYVLKLLKEHKNIRTVLTLLPPNYPVKQVVVNGKSIQVTHFLFFNESTGIAYFANENETISVFIHKIEAIYWG